MKIGKRLMALLLAVVLLAGVVPVTAFADAVCPDDADFNTVINESTSAAWYGNAVSGDLNAAKPTKQQIAEKFLTVTSADSIYEVEPVTVAPYASGQLTESFLNNGLTFLNYARYVAGLSPVKLDPEMNAHAQDGALLLNVSEYSHTPPQPADMDDELYASGYGATSSSNIGAGFSDLQDFVLGCLHDGGSIQNAETVGHRRWFLNPSMLYTGFGYVEGCVAAKAFDRSAAAADYDYIAWPASGNFPTNLFDSYVSWSVSLNPRKYMAPVLENITVTITRMSDGNTVTIDSNTGYPNYYGMNYLTVNLDGYGIANCIIFAPPMEEIGEYYGAFQVDISGIYTKAGEATTLSYQVDFFDIEDYLTKPVITVQPTDIIADPGDYCYVSVDAMGNHLQYQWYMLCPGETTPVTLGSETQIYFPVTAWKQNNAKIYCVITDAKGNSVTTNTVTLTINGTPLAITAQPQDVLVDMGQQAETSVTAVGEGLTYQWYGKLPGESQFYQMWNTEPAISIKMEESTSGMEVYCVITDIMGESVTTDTVTLKARAAVEITTQPEDVYVESGKTAEVTVEATGEGLTYQWYYKDKGDSEFKLTTAFTGSTYSLKMTSARNGRQVYCVVTDENGNTATSDVVSLNLKKTLKITKQPASDYAKSGEKASVKVKASGDGLKYTWYVKNAGASKYTKSSITKSTYSVTMSSKVKDRLVYCVVTDQYGNSIKTKTVRLRMAATITKDPVTDYAKSGEKASVKVKASGDGLKYTWYVKNVGATKYTKSSVTKSTYSVTMNSKVKDRLVYCVVTDKYGNTDRSETVRLRMAATITTQPKDVTVAKGSKAKVTVKATGDELTYTWYIKNPGASKFTKSSVTKSSYSVTMTSKVNGRQVYCVVTDKYGNKVKSEVVTLKMK